MGKSMSDFLRETSIERAREVITKHERFKLTLKGQTQIMDAIVNPPPLNEELFNIARKMEEDGVSLSIFIGVEK